MICPHCFSSFEPPRPRRVKRYCSKACRIAAGNRAASHRDWNKRRGLLASKFIGIDVQLEDGPGGSGGGAECMATEGSLY